MKKFLVVACSLALALSVIELEPSAAELGDVPEGPSGDDSGSKWGDARASTAQGCSRNAAGRSCNRRAASTEDGGKDDVNSAIHRKKAFKSAS